MNLHVKTLGIGYLERGKGGTLLKIFSMHSSPLICIRFPKEACLRTRVTSTACKTRCCYATKALSQGQNPSLIFYCMEKETISGARVLRGSVAALVSMQAVRSTASDEAGAT